MNPLICKGFCVFAVVYNLNIRGDFRWKIIQSQNRPLIFRISKSHNGNTYEFIYNGSNLVAMTNTGTTLFNWICDENGDYLGFTYCGVEYYYIRNLQNDVIGIKNTSGKVVVEYEYDPFGKVLATKGPLADTLGKLNPIRYRGYFYDTETGFYFLQSRYYDPETCRFINADEASVVTVSPDSANYDKNLYAYCDNNPVVRADSSGYVWVTTVGLMLGGGAIGAAISAISSAVTQKMFDGSVNWKSVGVAAASGFASGALAASPLSKVAITIIGAGIDVVSYGLDCLAYDKNYSADELVFNVGVGVLLNYKYGDNGLNYNNRLNQVVDYADDVIKRGSKEGANQYRKNAAQSAKSYRNNYLCNEFSGLAFDSIKDNTIVNGIGGLIDWAKKLFS